MIAATPSATIPTAAQMVALTAAKSAAQDNATRSSVKAAAKKRVASDRHQHSKVHT